MWMFLRYLTGWVSDSVLLIPRLLRPIMVSLMIWPSSLGLSTFLPDWDLLYCFIRQSIILHFGVSVAFCVSQCPLLYKLLISIICRASECICSIPHLPWFLSCVFVYWQLCSSYRKKRYIPVSFDLIYILSEIFYLLIYVKLGSGYWCYYKYNKCPCRTFHTHAHHLRLQLVIVVCSIMVSTTV